MQPAAVALRRAPCNGKPESVAGAFLCGRAEKRLAEVCKVLFGNAFAVVADADFGHAVFFTQGNFDGLPGWVKAQRIAQQVVERA